MTRRFPDEWIAPDGNDVLPAWTAWAAPLAGEIAPAGALRRVPVAKRLGTPKA